MPRRRNHTRRKRRTQKNRIYRRRSRSHGKRRNRRRTRGGGKASDTQQGLEGRSGDRRTPAQRADDDRKYKIMDWRVAQKAAEAGDWSAEGMKARVSPPAKVSSAASSASSGGRRRRR